MSVGIFREMALVPLQEVMNELRMLIYHVKIFSVRSDLTVKQHTSTEIWPRKLSSDVEMMQKFCFV